jgi:hypothetical protein
LKSPTVETDQMICARLDRIGAEDAGVTIEVTVLAREA